VASLSAPTRTVLVERGSHGTTIDIPAGVALDEPILIAYDIDVATMLHTQVTVGDGARVTIVERIVGGGLGVNARATADVIAGDRADVTYAVLNLSADGSNVEAHRQSTAGVDAHTRWCLALLGGSRSEDELTVKLARTGDTGEISALLFPVGKQNAALATTALHVVGSTVSDTVVRAIAAGHGRGRFFGNIRIAAQAHGSEASLRDDSLIFGKDAHIDAIPALEIAANDVKAFHGATVGAIDDEHLFYVMSRGIDRLSAEKLIALGFFEPALARFPGEALRDELRGLLEAKLAGARA
jgi:Fe-S cluster assembly protein SufD